MAEKQTEQPEIRVRGSIWVWIAVPLTVVYLAALWNLVVVTKACEPAGVGVVAQYLGCKSVNELGDFLAGAFAPLAFLWLVVAVLVQAQELKSQRAELALTRAEMKLNRDVASSTREEIAAQATAAKANAEFVRQQTDILKREADREDRRTNNERFDSLLRLADNILRTQIAGNVFLGNVENENTGAFVLRNDDWGDDPQINLIRASKSMREAIDSKRDVISSGQLALRRGRYSRQLGRLAAVLHEIHALSDLVDYAASLVDALELEPWIIAIDWLIDEALKYPQKD